MLYYLWLIIKTGSLQKPAAFHSEKRCKDKQKKSRLQVFSEVKKQGYKEGYKKV